MVVLQKTSMNGETFDPATQVYLVAMLLALVLTGIFLMIVAWLAARVVRRYAGFSSKRIELSSPTANSEDDWWRQPLVLPNQEDFQE